MGTYPLVAIQRTTRAPPRLAPARDEIIRDG